jgi:SAM-dependent methyltransferase
MDATSRFSDRVDDYVKYRPGYPAGVLALLRKECGLTPLSIIADIGSGTGKLTELLLSNGNTVYAVEPNRPMRLAAERLLSGVAGFRSVEGRAEATTLAGSAIDIVTAGQAFHWFEPDTAALEFRRILRENGHVALIWNEREESDSPFFAEYDGFLRAYSVDYTETRRRNVVGPDAFRRFFSGEYGHVELRNSQARDFDALLGGYLSASYALTRVHPLFPEARLRLEELFLKYAVGGELDLPYRTRVIFAPFGKNRD